MSLLPSFNQFLWTHIDTCLPCYLRDSFSRDGELLLGVFVDGESTVGDVLDALKNEFYQVGWDLAHERRGYDQDKASQALDRLIAENADRRALIFDCSLERYTNEEFDDGECVQAWFLLTWDVPNEGE